jgi:nitrate/TMAO reductase-like tetraheme cytochrome c subunit
MRVYGRTFGLLAVVLAFLLGALSVGGLVGAVDYTNRLEFCIACHEMEQTVYREYLASPHFKNPSGTGATCADCHVPRAWPAKLWRKVRATGELYHWLRGTIDTPEKFEAHRLELAERVWAEMEATDSRECRACHSAARMDFHEQSRRAQEKMQPALEEGKKTCIDCHKGIAHELPEDYEDD